MNIKPKHQIGLLVVMFILFFPLAAKAGSITSISPRVIKNGDTVTINGSGFTSNSGGHAVILNTPQGKAIIAYNPGVYSPSAMDAISWTDSKIVFKMQNMFNSGTLSVEMFDTYDYQKGEYNYTQIMGQTVISNNIHLSGYIATTGRQGDDITINGSNFTNDQGVIAIGGIIATIKSWPESTNNLIAIIPKNATPGVVPIEIYLHDENGQLFLAASTTTTVYRIPNEEITSISPSTAASGDTVIIYGNNLTETYNVTVRDSSTSSGIYATDVVNGNGAITFKIPFNYVLNTVAIDPGYKQGLPPGIYDIEINSTASSDYAEKKAVLTIVEPSKKITGVDKASVKADDMLKIFGTGFTSELSIILKLLGGVSWVISPGNAVSITNGTYTIKIPATGMSPGVYDVYLHGPNDVVYSKFAKAFTYSSTSNSTQPTEPTINSTPNLSSNNLSDYGVTQKEISGKLVKLDGSSTVYLVQDGKRLAFPNQKIYESWFGKDFSAVTKVTPEELSSYTLTRNVQYKPGSLLKIPSIPKVYLVADNGVLKWITTEEKFKALGFSFNQVQDLPESFFVGYEIGSDI